MNRREFIQGSMVMFGAAAFASGSAAQPAPRPPAFKLGLVTYNLAREWDVPTILARCKATGFAAVELRTTHAHGVEPGIDAAGARDTPGSSKIQASCCGGWARCVSSTLQTPPSCAITSRPVNASANWHGMSVRKG